MTLLLPARVLPIYSEAVACVFLSYRHENEAHKTQVRELGERLEQAGLTVILDQFAQEREFCRGGPPEGWPQWCVNQAGNPKHKILAIASPGWFRCYEGKEVPGTGLGAAAEARVIRQRLYNAAGINPDIRIVYFDARHASEAPLDLQGYHRFQVPAEFDDIVVWLTGTVPVPPSAAVAADWPDAPSVLVWRAADQDRVREDFCRLLTRSAPWRCLLVRGDGETGKTHLTQLMYGSALDMANLACGRFDFKGTTDVELEMRSFVMHLNVPPPKAGMPLNDRLGQVLDALKERARPALLIFDTFEQAGVAQDWVERLLLPATLRAPWLRVVVAGQRVPDCTGAPWAGQASQPIELQSPEPRHWFEYGRVQKPGLTQKFVDTAYTYCQGRASVLAQLLGPAA